MPELAPALQARADIRLPGGDVVLRGPDGVGKSQFAANEARHADADLVMWVPAGSAEGIVAAYARAAARLRLPGADGTDAVAGARALLGWLATTERPWLVVLDDLDPAAAQGWWPAGSGAGRVLATTRDPSAGGLAIPVFTAEQSAAYLTERLTAAGAGHLADDGRDRLAAALGHLPLALAHAAACMIDLRLGCGEYLARFTDRRARVPEPVAVTVLLALDAIGARYPAAPASVVIWLVALLDPDGQPDALWNTPAIAKVLGDQGRTALLLLQRYALITYDRRAEPRAIRIHPVTARAVREWVEPKLRDGAVETASFLLAHAWPPDDRADPELAAVLRANTTALLGHGIDQVWPGGDPRLIPRAGRSYLTTAGHPAAAVAFWRAAAGSAERVLGAGDRATLDARTELARAHHAAGRTDAAIAELEQIADDQDAWAARAALGVWLGEVGRWAEAVKLLERALAEAPHRSGPPAVEPPTLRANLALAYARTARPDEAIEQQQRVVADLGGHPPAVTTLAGLLTDAGRPDEAVALLDNLLAGHGHGDLDATGQLARAHWAAGRREQALRLAEPAQAERTRLLGPDHPATVEHRAELGRMCAELDRPEDAVALLEPIVRDDAIRDPEARLTARASLAEAYTAVSRPADALALAEEILAERRETNGLDDPRTFAARGALARHYRAAGRDPDAVRVQEQIVAQAGRLFGPDAPETLTARADLAHAYGKAHRTADAVRVGAATLSDATRALGPDHPTTLTTAHDLAAWYAEQGRTADAFTCAARAATGRTKTLGADHPDAIASRVAHALLLARTTGAAPAALSRLRAAHADQIRVLGPDAPATRAVAETLDAFTSPQPD